MENLAYERRWYKVPFLQYNEMRFFNRINEDGSISYRNMPFMKKNKRAQRHRVEQEMEELKNKLSLEREQSALSCVSIPPSAYALWTASDRASPAQEKWMYIY